MLASGNRPYVLVDSFGKMHALPRLIEDRDVRTKQVEAYLKDDFPPESLSTVGEAVAVAEKIQESRKRIELSQKLKEQQEILQRDQAERRKALQAEIANVQEKQRQEAAQLSDIYNDKLYAEKLNAAQKDMEINFRRAAYAPTGLAAFLSRVSGMDAVRQKIHFYQDKKREVAFEAVRMKIEHEKEKDMLRQQHEHLLEMIELRRRENEQVKGFEREQRSIEMAIKREHVAHYSRGYQHMPSVQLALKPPGRGAVPAKASRRFYAPTVKDPNIKKTRRHESQGTAETQVGPSTDKHIDAQYWDMDHDVGTIDSEQWEGRVRQDARDGRKSSDDGRKR